MFAVLLQHLRRHHAHFAKDEGNDGQLEHHAHKERQRCECGDIRVERDGAMYPLRHLVSSQKSERYGEYHEIAHQHPYDE